MGSMTFFVGGCRSGKSRLALQEAARLSEHVCFLATCVPCDDQMRARVDGHRRERPPGWHLIEEPLCIAETIETLDATVHPVILLDCLTLWVGNLMCRTATPVGTEEQMSRETERFLESVRSFDGHVIVVSNEVGMGIVPVNDMARTYVDLAGRCNQMVAQAAGKVVFVVSGIGQVLKGTAR